MNFKQIVNYCWVVDWSAKEGWHIDIDFLSPSSEIYTEKEEDKEKRRKKNNDGEAFIFDSIYCMFK